MYPQGVLIPDSSKIFGEVSSCQSREWVCLGCVSSVVLQECSSHGHTQINIQLLMWLKLYPFIDLKTRSVP